MNVLSLRPSSKTSCPKFGLLSASVSARFDFFIRFFLVTYEFSCAFVCQLARQLRDRKPLPLGLPYCYAQTAP